MDGVLADFDAGIERQLADLVPGLAPYNERTQFHIIDSRKEHHEAISAIRDAEGFFRNLPLIDGAIKGWQRIIDLGYEPRICSSPLLSHLRCREEKLEWLEEHLVPHFGRSVVEQAIIDRDKANHHGIALIDDKPQIRNAEKAVWQHIIFDHSYNREIRTDLRLHGWDDPQLESLLREAESRAA